MCSVYTLYLHASSKTYQMNKEQLWKLYIQYRHTNKQKCEPNRSRSQLRKTLQQPNIWRKTTKEAKKKICSKQKIKRSENEEEEVRSNDGGRRRRRHSKVNKMRTQLYIYIVSAHLNSSKQIHAFKCVIFTYTSHGICWKFLFSFGVSMLCDRVCECVSVCIHGIGETVRRQTRKLCVCLCCCFVVAVVVISSFDLSFV